MRFIIIMYINEHLYQIKCENKKINILKIKIIINKIHFHHQSVW